MLKRIAIESVEQQHQRPDLALEQRVAKRTAEPSLALSVVDAQRLELENALRMRDETQRRLEAELEDAHLLHGISAMLIDENTLGDLYQKLVDAATLVMRSDFGAMRYRLAGRRHDPRGADHQQPAQQRGQIHAAGRPDRAGGAHRRRPGRHPRHRQGDRHPRRDAAEDFRVVHADGRGQRSVPGPIGRRPGAAQQLAEMHEGGIEVASRDGEGGSVFSLRLPNAAAATVPAADQDRGLARAEGRASRLRIVDDNADAAETLAMLLEELGRATCVVLEARKALAAALAFQPDMVFLDIGMPHLNGYVLARQLRGQSALEGVHLVAPSGWGSDEDRARSRDAGIDHHLTKPVLLNDVIGLLAAMPARA